MAGPPGPGGELWFHIPATEFLNNQEFSEAYPLFSNAMASFQYGDNPYDNADFQAFLDYMGMTEMDMPYEFWDEFREMYDASH